MAEPFEILLVEDYEPDAQLLLRLLKKHLIHNRMHLVWDGAQALDYVFARGAHRNRRQGAPLVVILDIRLPKVDGWEVLRQIKTDPASSTIPVIMVSGCVSDQERGRAHRLGATACLSKPVHFEELQDSLAVAGFACSPAPAGAI